MDKGIKKLQKHVKKIEDSNNQILDRTLDRIFKLKNTRLSDISCKKTQTFEILIHKDTNNFPLVKQTLLSRIGDLHIQYPFMSLCFDPHSPEKIRKTVAENENRLLLTINWEDYVRYSLKEVPRENTFINIVGSAIPEQMIEINRKNAHTIQEALAHIFKTANQHILDEKSDLRIMLEKNTMSYEVTRNHISYISQQIIRNYNGLIEIFNNNESMITIRVHWNVYLAQIAAFENQHRQVPLLSTNNYAEGHIMFPYSSGKLNNFDKNASNSVLAPNKNTKETSSDSDSARLDRLSMLLDAGAASLAAPSPSACVASSSSSTSYPSNLSINAF
ncbi:MAG: hypothetical protein WD512_20610, partial [Candidatus Paceibacterota bacterium]